MVYFTIKDFSRFESIENFKRESKNSIHCEIDFLELEPLLEGDEIITYISKVGKFYTNASNVEIQKDCPVTVSFESTSSNTEIFAINEIIFKE